MRMTTLFAAALCLLATACGPERRSGGGGGSGGSWAEDAGMDEEPDAGRIECGECLPVVWCPDDAACTEHLLWVACPAEPVDGSCSCRRWGQRETTTYACERFADCQWNPTGTGAWEQKPDSCGWEPL